MAFDVTKMFRDPPRTNPDEVYLSQYEKGRKSVFVANLPNDITEGELRQAFEESGDVVDVQIIQKPHKTFGAFAFVEFSRPDMPDVAVRQWVSVSLILSLYFVLTHLTAWQGGIWCRPPC